MNGPQVGASTGMSALIIYPYLNKLSGGSGTVAAESVFAFEEWSLEWRPFSVSSTGLPEPGLPHRPAEGPWLAHLWELSPAKLNYLHLIAPAKAGV